MRHDIGPLPGVERALSDTTFDTTFQKSYQSRIEHWDWFGRAVQKTLGKYDDQNIICPHCNTPTNPGIPDYPRFKGPGVIIFFWIFFVILCIGLMVSYYGQ